MTDLIERDAVGRFATKSQTGPEVRLDSVHPDVLAARRTERLDRHQLLTAEGAYATPFNNTFIADFEDEHPDADRTQVQGALDDLPWDEDWLGSDLEDERRAAAAELSRRLQPDVPLEPVRMLRRGDIIDVTGFLGGDEGDEPVQYEVARFDGDSDGREFVHLSNGGVFTFSTGSVVHVIR